MTATRRTRLTLVGVMLVMAGCSNSQSSSAEDSPTVVTPAVPASPSTPAAPASPRPDQVVVVFDSPGADPRPLREVPVALRTPTTTLAMTVTKLSYRGLVCGFTFTGTRPASPVTITVSGSTNSATFASGPVPVRWSADGTVKAGQPPSDNGWNFSADAYPNRNGSGWVVSIGAVTGEGDDVIPTAAACRLSSSNAFVEANGPVGYWAGFASR